MKVFLALIVALYCVFLAQPLQAQVSEAPPLAPVWVESSDSWQLPESHFVGAKMPMTVVHPRSFPAADGGDETASWARHKKAYPGIEYRIPISIQGGAYPFYYEILQGPAWLSIGQTYQAGDEYGVLSGTPPPPAVAAAVTVRVKITDQERTEKIVEFPLTVTDSTNDFLFVDVNAATSGDGSLASPFNSLGDDVLNSGSWRESTYPGRAIYLRGGRHYMPQGWDSTNQVDTSYYRVQSNEKPYVFLGYPGENAIIDFTNTKIITNGGGDMFFGGLTLDNSTLQTQSNFVHVWSMSRFTWFDLKLRNIKNASNYQNDQTISNEGGIHVQGGDTLRPYWTFWNLDISDVAANSSGLGSFYSSQYEVFENIKYGTGGGDQNYGIMLKGVNKWVSIRRVDIGFAGGWTLPIRNYNRTTQAGNPARYVEITYSLVGQPEGQPKNGNIITMLTYEPSGDQIDPPSHIWAYRNTIIGGHIGPEYSAHAHLSYEGNVSFVDQADHFPVGSKAYSLMVEGNLTGSYADRSVYLDENYRLKAPHRESWIGKVGHEIHH